MDRIVSLCFDASMNLVHEHAKGFEGRGTADGKNLLYLIAFSVIVTLVCVIVMVLK